MSLFTLAARTKATFACLIVFLVIGTTVACSSVLGANGTWRYKMTVAIETPEGIKTGSAVREVSAMGGGIKLSPQAMAQVDVKGEAVVVDLGQRGVVFALLRGGSRGPDYADAVLYKALPVPNGIAPLTPEGIRYYSNLEETPPVELAQDNLPMFVRFRDMADPKTVEAVNLDVFESSFGEGVKLKYVTIEITREAITIGVVNRYLHWIYQIKSNLDGTNVTLTNDLANNLDWGSFVRGIKQ